MLKEITIENIKELKKFWNEELNLTKNVVACYLTCLRKTARKINQPVIELLSFNPTSKIELKLLDLKEKGQITLKDFYNCRSGVRAYQKYIDSLFDQKG